jgi:predicted SAM-dependent methyltransferase
MRLKPLDALALLFPPLLTRAAGALSRLATDAIARLRIAGHDKLHLACGRNRMPGWANVDLEGPLAVIRLDLTRPLPVASNRMACIYSEHFIEHIEQPAAARLLRECHRVLRPGGVLRLSTPSLAVLVDHYRSGRLDYWADMNWRPQSPAHLLNEGLSLWGHRFVYDAAALEAMLRDAGFTTIEQREWQHSPTAALAGIECRPFHGELIYDCVK